MVRILVADDTRNIRKMVSLTLQQQGHEVHAAEDGAQALELFGDGSGWDLTLVDQRMPGREGSAIVEEARRRDPAARLIMMTAFATSELAAAVLAAGAVDFLRKPFTADVLRGAVAGALSHPRERPALPGTNEAAALPEPGQPGFPMARVSWRINGFSFWPMASPQTQAKGLGFGRVFQIRRPEGSLGQCFVGVTPHVRELAQTRAGRELADDDPLWDDLCGEALLNYIWEKGAAPPGTLPVFDLPRGPSRGGKPASWGPFGSK